MTPSGLTESYVMEVNRVNVPRVSGVPQHATYQREETSEVF